MSFSKGVTEKSLQEIYIGKTVNWKVFPKGAGHAPACPWCEEDLTAQKKPNYQIGSTPFDEYILTCINCKWFFFDIGIEVRTGASDLEISNDIAARIRDIISTLRHSKSAIKQVDKIKNIEDILNFFAFQFILVIPDFAENRKQVRARVLEVQNQPNEKGSKKKEVSLTEAELEILAATGSLTEHKQKQKAVNAPLYKTTIKFLVDNNHATFRLQYSCHRDLLVTGFDPSITVDLEDGCGGIDWTCMTNNSIIWGTLIKFHPDNATRFVFEENAAGAIPFATPIRIIEPAESEKPPTKRELTFNTKALNIVIDKKAAAKKQTAPTIPKAPIDYPIDIQSKVKVLSGVGVYLLFRLFN